MHVLEIIERQICSAAVNKTREIFSLNCSFWNNVMSNLGPEIEPAPLQTCFGSSGKISIIQLLPAKKYCPFRRGCPVVLPGFFTKNWACSAPGMVLGDRDSGFVYSEWKHFAFSHFRVTKETVLRVWSFFDLLQSFQLFPLCSWCNIAVITLKQWVVDILGSCGLLGKMFFGGFLRMSTPVSYPHSPFNLTL